MSDTDSAPPRWLILDTETSSLPDYKMPADHPDQPRLAAITMIICDANLEATSTYTRFIKPDGWVLDPGAAAVNKLTLERLEAEGVRVDEVLNMYTAYIDQGFAVAAFGAQFDCKIMRGELRRALIDDRFEKTKNFCIMRKSPRVKKLNGKGGWPGLVDICAHYGIDLSDAHTSLGDAMAALQVMRRLKAEGVDLTPSVHFAKETPERKAGKTKLTSNDVKLQDGDQF